MSAFLTICIPTYNHSGPLRDNLEMLASHIGARKLQDDVCTLVSDNCSTDDTGDMLLKFKEAHPDISFSFITQEENIGAEKNVIAVLDAARSEYLLMLGADDYISEEYLVTVIQQLRESSDIGCVIPSIECMTFEGQPMGVKRDVGLPSSISEAGFSNCIQNAWRGHQLSGLVFRSSDFVAAYRQRGVSNIYPTIFLVAYISLRLKTWHYTDHPVKVTVVPQAEKGWSYGEDGLIGDVFNNFRCLTEISGWQRLLLELSFLHHHSVRYENYLMQGIMPFLRACLRIVSSKNTSFTMKFLFPFFVPVQGIFRLFQMRGQLLTRYRDQRNLQQRFG